MNENHPLVEFVDSPDGWRLATYRYPRPLSRRHPVLLVHGLGTNRYDVDFPDPRLSLAKFLHSRGFDTWFVELRGTGRSYKSNLLSRYLSHLRTNWTFDDYAFKDLPAVVAHIQKVTGKTKLHWVGHSLGGTLVYAAIEALGNNVCASAVTLGAAMSATSKIGLIRFLEKIDPFIKPMPYLPMKHMALAGAPIARWLAPMEDNFFYASDNIDLKTIEIGLQMAVENVSTALFLQLHDWYTNNHFRSRDHSFSYRDHLKKIEAPFLICAGSVDGLTGYPDVHFPFRQIRSKKKRFRVFSRETGCRTEYGHMDLMLGKNAPREVFPEIANWFNEPEWDGGE